MCDQEVNEKPASPPKGNGIAILCPGPSLRVALVDLPVHDCYIGVNGAAAAFACDWWVFLDLDVCRPSRDCIVPMGCPVVCSTQYPLPKTREFTWYPYEALAYRPPYVPRFSFPVALILAVNLYLGFRTRHNPGPITVYGADLKGNTYFDGSEKNHLVSDFYWEARWHRERFIVAWLLEWAVQLRVPIRGLANDLWYCPPLVPKPCPFPVELFEDVIREHNKTSVSRETS